MTLSRIWAAFRTADQPSSGTNSTVSLSINEDGFDLLEYNFPDTTQADFERDSGGIYELNIGQNSVVPEDLSNSSIRVANRGADKWISEFSFFWGTRRGSGAVVPIAFDYGIGISADKDEGPMSIPIRLASAGGIDEEFNILMILATNSDQPDAGTPHNIQIEFEFADRMMGPFNFRPATGKGNASVEFNTNFPIGLPQDEPTPPNNRDQLRAITLRTSSSNAWLPKNFFLFGAYGFPTNRFRPEYWVPLVNIPNWSLPPLSTDTSDFGGTARPVVRLPLAEIETARRRSTAIRNDVFVKVR
jgi:hypothetical protein